MWRKNMTKARANPNVLDVCSDDRLLANLIESITLLDVVQRGLTVRLPLRGCECDWIEG